MHKIYKGIITCFILLIILTFFVKSSLAINDFSDDFSNNLNNWNIYNIGGTSIWSIDVNDGMLLELSSAKGSSYLVSKKDDFCGNFNFSYEAKNLKGIDQEFIFDINPNRTSYYVINTRFPEPLWNDSQTNQVVLWKYLNGSYSQIIRVPINSISLEKNVKYNFKFIANDDGIKFYINNNLILENNSIKNVCGSLGFWSWGGDFSVSNKYDNFYGDINVGSTLIPTLTSTPTPTLIPTSTPVPTLIPTSTPIPTLTPVPTLTPIPTPTAVPTPIIRKKKIFILPGLGASWNSEAIVYGKNVNDNDWKMTPMVNNYDGLIEMLDKNDLKKDEDYFVWNYDWRRPIEEIKSKFDIFIKSKNLNRNDDIYLIGHSLGGLVVRLWAQDNNDNENIKQIISLGSPNLGSLDSYSVWNGGEILKYDGISSVAFQILLGLQNKGFVLTDIDKIRNFAPISKDLLPTFDYVSKNNQIIPWKNLRYFNDYLDDKNRFVSSVSSKLFSFGGIGLSTPNNLRLGGRSIYDKVLNLWPDGEILSIKKGNGDETVLKESSLFGTNNFIELNSDHKEITTKSINQLTDQLGLERQPIEFVYHDNFKNNLIVFIGSPSKAELKCGNEIYQENNGFIIAKNKNYRDCDLNLFPTDNGLVHIIAGNTNQNQWNYFEKEVKLGINNSVKILFKDGSISNDKKNLSFLKDQIENDLKTLGLLKAIKFLDKNDLEKIALVVFEYRNKNEERIISQRILDNLFYLSRVISKNKNNYNYKNLEKYVNFINLMTDLKSKRGKLNENSALSLVLLENLKDKVKKDLNNKVYSSVSMITILSSGYGLEAIK